jgi:hypothetical protein
MADLRTLMISDKDCASGCSLLIEDDGRVAYAYFLSPEDEIIGDVWLYNRCRAPLNPEWADKAKAPFANPLAFAHSSFGVELPEKESDFDIHWSRSEMNTPVADVYLRKVLIARLCAGAKPGWSIAAKKDGPLAKVLK